MLVCVSPGVGVVFWPLLAAFPARPGRRRANTPSRLFPILTSPWIKINCYMRERRSAGFFPAPQPNGQVSRFFFTVADRGGFFLVSSFFFLFSF